MNIISRGHLQTTYFDLSELKDLKKMSLTCSDKIEGGLSKLLYVNCNFHDPLEVDLIFRDEVGNLPLNPKVSFSEEDLAG